MLAEPPPYITADAEAAPPHSIEAETSVLGAILLHDSAWPVAASSLEADDFYRDAHRRIWRAMARLADKGSSPADLVIVKNELARSNELSEIGGPAYLASLVDGLPHATNVGRYAAIVRDAARLRQAVTVAREVTAAAYAHSASAADVVEAGVTGLLAIADTATATATRVRDAAKEYVESLDDPLGETTPMLSGYADLDQLVGGWQRGQFVIVAARTSVGKSSFALGTASAVAKGGIPAAIVTLEMDRRQLVAQLLSWRSGVPAERIRRRQASDSDYTRLSDAWIALEDVPLFFVEAARTLTQVAAWARRLRDQHGVGCIVVDYLQRLLHDVGARRDDRRRAEVAAVSFGLKRLAMDLGIVVVGLSQLNRAPEARTDKRPQLADLKESGDIEQDADVALLLFREEMHKKSDGNDGIAEVIVAKNRSGPTGTIKLYFDKNLARFSDLARV